MTHTTEFIALYTVWVVGSIALMLTVGRWASRPARADEPTVEISVADRLGNRTYTLVEGGVRTPLDRDTAVDLMLKANQDRWIASTR